MGRLIVFLGFKSIWQLIFDKFIFGHLYECEAPDKIHVRFSSVKDAGPGADLGGGCRGCALPPPPRDDPRFSNTTGILQNYVVYWC